MNSVKRSAQGRPKSTEKQHQVLVAASCLFLTNGFSGTSMDNVAKKAGVSKQTVYSHYKNKDALYSAVIEFKVREYQLDEEHVRELGADIKAVLTMVGRQFVQLLHDEEVISMYRVVIGEISTNPHVAELFFNAGPKQAMQMLARYLVEFCPSMGQENARYCSMVFFNLLKGEHHMKSLMGLPGAMSKSEQTLFVDKIVGSYRTMLAQFVPEAQLASSF